MNQWVRTGFAHLRTSNCAIRKTEAHQTTLATVRKRQLLGRTTIAKLSAFLRLERLPTTHSGLTGSKFWMEEWGYPDISVYFADCPSAGHDMFCLDYRDCGPRGEPKVVHIHQGGEYKITPVADSFEAFVRGLESADNFDDE